MPHAAPAPPAAPFLSPGLRQMVLAAFCFSLMTLCAKVVGGRIPSGQIILCRTLITLAGTWTLLRHAGIRNPFGERHHGLLFLRGLAGFLALDCLFYALPRLPLAEATVLQYLNPVFVALLAAAFLGERLTGRALAALGLCMAGLVLVARPAWLFGGAVAPLDGRAVAFALAGAFLSSVAYVTIRRIGAREHPLVIVFYLPLVSLPAAAFFSARAWVPPTPWEWALLVAIGALTQIAQVALTKALTRETAGRATTVGTLQIVFAATWGFMFLGEVPAPLALGGTILVAAGVVLAARARPAMPAVVPASEA